MKIEEQRKAFEEYYIANYHDGDIHPHQKLLEWSKDGESCVNSTVDNLWDMWLASTNREGYKLVPLEATQEMVDAVYNSTLDSDDLEGIYKAMIGACDEP